MRNLILVVDYGTSNVRVNAINTDNGETVYSASRKYPVKDRGKGYAEISEQDLWEFSESCMEQVVLKLCKNDVPRAISFSFFGDNLIPIDEDGNALQDCILCTDSRGSAEADYINEQMPINQQVEIIGDSYTLYKFGAKLLNVKNSYTYQTRKPVFYDSQQQYIFRKLGLKPVNDTTMASRKQLCDIETGEWSEEFLKILGIKEEALGDIVATDEVVGYIKQYGSVKFQELIPVIAGGHDCDVAMIGMGVLDGKEEFVGDITGTFDHVGFIKEGIINAGKEYSQLPIQSYRGPLKDSTVCLGAFPTAGATLEWFMREINDGTDQAEYKKYWDKVLFDAENKIRIYPTLDNHNGKIEGIGVTTSKTDLFQGIIEALTFENRRLIEDCEICKGTSISSVRIGGGSAQSDEWMQLRADISGKKIERMRNIQISSVGSAILAAVKVGIYPSLQEAVKYMVHIEDTFYPNLEVSKKYEKQYQEYLGKMNYERSINYEI